MKEKIIEKITNNFKLSKHELKLVNSIVVDDINLDRLDHVLDVMIEYYMQNEVLVAYLLFQFHKVREEEAKEHEKDLTASQLKLYETFKMLRNVNKISKSGEAEDIKRMFIAICQDMRVVIIKFATIDYDLHRITLPLDEENRKFVKMVSEIFAPLAESLGLSRFKNSFEETTFQLLEPKVYNELKNNVLMKTDDNMKQLEIVEKKLVKILQELGIEGEIQKRQKHIRSNHNNENNRRTKYRSENYGLRFGKMLCKRTFFNRCDVAVVYIVVNNSCFNLCIRQIWRCRRIVGF